MIRSNPIELWAAVAILDAAGVKAPRGARAVIAAAADVRAQLRAA